ncbi:response regulator [Motiliproteus sp. MSK22-1]|uniref:response regulator n=1 Tax=Motiliproteus sp. MSK22-1 TaxID=1897630 RepID=UPI0009773361|nr:response regulator [Motiliproteus sp. MSK22-1]OMH32089.1 two-component system response regulator [Motiliproteus sp. MSK22-1]
MKKILVVEDDPVQQQRMCDILKNLDVLLSVADNGSSAVEKAQAEQPDLILMDIIMPGVDGYAACRSITTGETTKQIPVIIVSSKNQEADKVWAQLQGAQALVGKPYTEEEILTQVKAFL